MVRSHRGVAIGLALALVAAVVAVVVIRSNTSQNTASVGEPTASASAEPQASGDPEASGQPTSQPQDSAAPVTAAPISLEEAERAALSTIDGYLAASVGLLGQPDSSSDPVAVYASGEALSEIQNQALQFDEEGIRLSGVSRADGTSVTGSDLSADPATITITACIDDTGITVFTPDAPNGVKSTQRSRTVFVVAYSDGQWKVITRAFADDVSC